MRDHLIADQENLLNAYRCLFNVDVDLVPGQCPNPDIVTPGPPPANPTRDDIAARDRLIAEQEALLNVYRCKYNVDTELVPGGCLPPAEEATTTSEDTTTGEATTSEETTGDETEAPPTLEDILLRDYLIADQENLLNAYRCLFNVDVHLVPGQCPNPDIVTPGAPPANPTRDDIAARDQLIDEQEALLNVYRCKYNVDTELVPGGCPTPAKAPA